MTIISVTRLRLRANRYLPQFMWFTTLSTWQAWRSPGNLKIRLLRDLRRTFWTLTVWQDQAAMRAFMSSGTHRRAMLKLPDWCDEASVVHWTQETTDLPDWQQAHRRMVDEGRLSKVHYPSPTHQAGKITAPFAATP